VPAGHEQATEALLKSVPQTAVPEPAAIDEEVLEFRIASIAGRIGNEARETDRTRAGVDLKELVAYLAAEKESNPIAQRGRGGNVINDFPVVRESQVKRRCGQGEPGHRLADMAELGGDTLEELLTDRDVEEEMANLDARARGAAPGPHAGELAAV